MPKLLKLFLKIETEGVLPDFVYETVFTLLPKPHKDSTKKKNGRTIPFMDIDVKVLNKIPADRIQEHIKNVLHQDQVNFNSEKK